MQAGATTTQQGSESSCSLALTLAQSGFLPNRARRPQHFQDELVERDFGRGSRAAQAVCVAVVAEGLLEPVEDLTILPEVAFRHRHLAAGLALNIDKLDIAQQGWF